MDSIVLASRSPRRREILEKAGIPFVVCESDADEAIKSRRKVRSSVIDNASKKVDSALRRYEKGLVLGVDTVVVFGAKVLGKPRDEEEARRFLRMLSGNAHFVYSGITVRDASSGVGLRSCSVTEVVFQRMRGDDIGRYLRRGEWADKAGGYAVQGEAALFIKKITGSFYNVMGLPLEELFRILNRFEYFQRDGRYLPVERRGP
jgi:septum formation protein